MDQVRNEEVRRRDGVTRELADRAELSVLMCFVHMEIMEDRLVKRIIGFDERGVRLRGRPRML